jgi:hypothetical protein
VTAPSLAEDPVVIEAAPCRHGFITDLVLRCGRGEAAALESLFDMFCAPVSAKVAGQVPPHRVGAVVAEVFVQLWRQAPGFPPEGTSAVKWVMGLADGAAESPSLQAELELCRAECADLRAALATRPVIDQAKGILMARHGCSAEEAFRMLAQASQRENRKVRDVARRVIANVTGSAADVDGS